MKALVYQFFFSRRKNRKSGKKGIRDKQVHHSSIRVKKKVKDNIDYVKKTLDSPDDLKIRTITLSNSSIPCAFLYIEGIVDEQSIHESVLGNLENIENVPNEPFALLTLIYSKQIALNDVTKEHDLENIIIALLSGQTILFIDGVQVALAVETIGGNTRQIEEPLTETLIRGPRSGFVETLQTNLALIRREAKDPNIRFKTSYGGKRTKKRIVIAYVDGIAQQTLIDEVNRRLNTLNIQMIRGSGDIEEWIEDSFLSPFPQILNTERPDRVAAAIMQGKIAILVEGTPFALIAPLNISDVLHSPEDYYERWIVGTSLRILRYLGVFISIFLPAIYVALISIQPGMIPTDLVFSIASSREGVPFTPIVEALLMVVTLELLQEAGARLPQTIGQTIGIVGGLVIGEAAVQAGIVSPIMVIVVALTAIANFSIPSYSVAISFRVVRFAFMFASAILGLFGVVLMYIIVNIHLVNLKSIGYPFMSPFAPFVKSDWNDVIVRAPLKMLSNQSKKNDSFILKG